MSDQNASTPRAFELAACCPDQSKGCCGPESPFMRYVASLTGETGEEAAARLAVKSASLAAARFSTPRLFD